jgi:hypothetical protein
MSGFPIFFLIDQMKETWNGIGKEHGRLQLFEFEGDVIGNLLEYHWLYLS